MILWHLGATIASTRYTFRDDRMDLRFLALGAILPDLLDTPIGLVWFSSIGGVRLAAHSLLAAGAVMTAVVLSTRRGRPRRRWMAIAVGMLMHLLFDAMWQDSETLWWPFLGWDFSPEGAATAGAYVAGVLTDWRVWVAEAVGLAYLIGLARRAGLGEAKTRRHFFATGIVDVPIDRG